MSAARELARAVLDYHQACTDALTTIDSRLALKAEMVAMASRIFDDAPPPQESATVTEMRTYAREELCEVVKDETVLRWADELEAANKRIAELEAELATWTGEHHGD